jgi:hypothetical protein
MSVIEEQVRASTTPQEATLAIARGMDAVLAGQRQAAPADPWDEWTDHDAHPEAHRDFALTTQVQAAPVSVQIDTIHEQLKAATDEDTVRALQAKLRLIQDTGAVPDNVLPGEFVGIDEHGVVHLPTADPARQADRHSWAMQIKLGSSFLKMDDAEAAEAFAKGGPLWLYYGNREAIMQMPPEWKRMLVLDVQEDSVHEAHAMGRDVLKDLEAQGPAVTMEALADA